VPPGASQITYRALARIPAGQRLDFTSYVIRKGDTLAKVAARFKVTQADLLEANNLKAAQFKAGRRIQVPPAASVPIDERDLKPLSRSEKALLQQPLPTLPSIQAAAPGDPAEARPVETPVPQAKPQEPASVSVKPATHVVKRGETLFSISERYGIKLADLRKWNKVKRNRIAVGQVLKLRQP
jgi:membrane-bound lytic murein transglycosylase D